MKEIDPKICNLCLHSLITIYDHSHLLIFSIIQHRRIPGPTFHFIPVSRNFFHFMEIRKITLLITTCNSNIYILARKMNIALSRNENIAYHLTVFYLP